MSLVFSYFRIVFPIGFLVIAMVSSSLGWAAEPEGRLIDSPYEAVEARAIELTINPSGDVVGIRAKGCPGCPSSSILPSAELVLEAGRREINSIEAESFSGMPGVIHIYKPTGMAYRVTFSGGGE